MKRLLLLLAAAVWSISAGAQDTVRLKIVQTSDIHGSIFNYDFINNRPAHTSMMHAYTYIKAAREAYGNHLLLLDNGDNLQGQPAVYYYNFIDTTTPHLLVRIMNAMRYDAASVGNHDLEAGHAVYDRVARRYAFPLLAANAVKPNGTPYFVPYCMFERSGVKVAVLGMTNPHVPYWLPKVLWSGMTFTDIVESSAQWIQYIREHEQPDVLIGLIHAGAGNGTHSEENPSLYIAKNVAGYDALLIGHDHQRALHKVTNAQGDTVYILNPSNAARYLATLDIMLVKENGKYTKHIYPAIINVADFEIDSALNNQFAADFDAVKTFVSKPIGTFAKAITTRDAYFGPSAFIDLIHRIQLDVAQADISFAAPLSFDAQIPQGTVYVRDMFNLYRFENMLYTMELTGAEIKGYLNYSYGNWLNQMHSPNDHLLLFKPDSTEKSGQFTVPPYNFDSAAGILYEVDVTRPAGDMVHIISMANGAPFSETKTYRVAVNSYRGNGGGGLLQYGAHIAPAHFDRRVVQSTDVDLRYYLMQWIETQKTIDPQPLNQWKIIPETLVKEAARRDYDLLFGAQQ